MNKMYRYNNFHSRYKPIPPHIPSTFLSSAPTYHMSTGVIAGMSKPKYAMNTVKRLLQLTEEGHISAGIKEMVNFINASSYQLDA